MSISDAQYSAWLAADAKTREVLVEAVCNHGGSEIVRYLSRAGYGTGAADTPANQPYDARLTERITLTRRVSISATESSVQVSMSTIDVDNTDGALDDWLSDAWEKRSLKVFLGDPSWARADFRQVFAGRTAAIKPSGRGKLSLLVYDEMQRLNFPVSEAVLGGATVNKDAILPQTFGEVFNIAPLASNPALHEYQANVGTMQGVIEVRDNGAPVAFVADAANGKFTLSASPVGQITCDVQGAKTGAGAYVYTVADIVREIVTAYGDPTTRLLTGEVDSSNFSAFNSANPQHVGWFSAGKVNVLEACNQIAASVQASLHFSRAGKLRLWRPPTAPAASTMSFTTGNMRDGSLEATELLPATPAVTVGWGRNWTVMSQLAGGLPDSSIAEFKTEWRDQAVNDAAAIALRRYTTRPVREETMLIVEAEAASEAANRLAFRKDAHPILQFETTLAAIERELGDEIDITHPRFGCGTGRAGWVIGATEELGGTSNEFPVRLEVIL